MKNKWKISTLIIFCLCMTGCFYYRMTHLSKEDLEWINTPRKSIIFESNWGNRDTLFYTDRFIYNSTERFYFNEGEDGVYEAYAGYSFDLHKNNKKTKGNLLIKKKVDIDDLCARISLAHFGFKEYTPIKSAKFKIGREVYSNCIIADTTNSAYFIPVDDRDKIVKFVFSKKHGLIYYKYTSGEAFHRIWKVQRNDQLK